LQEALEFSIPFNNDVNALQHIIDYEQSNNNTIHEIYLSAPPSVSGCGRMVFQSNLNSFYETIEFIHKNNISANLIMNPSCEGSSWYNAEVMREKIEFVETLFEKHGLEAITIANPIYIQAIRRRIPGIEICASVVGEIDCLQKASLYVSAGANVITPDPSINRDLILLQRIKDITGAKIKLMVNEGCLYKCPYRRFHYNYISHLTRESIKNSPEVFLNNCVAVTAADPSQAIKSGWIRPEDTRKYSSITNSFKIVGRDWPSSIMKRAVFAYLDEEWNGDLFSILSSNIFIFGLNLDCSLDNKSLDNTGFFEKLTSCDKNCDSCDYCANLANKLIKVGTYSIDKRKDQDSIMKWLKA